MKNTKPGKTGNEILIDFLTSMKKRKDKRLYLLPHCWRSWSWCGSNNWSLGEVRIDPGKGDLHVIPNTWFSIELSITTNVPEWDGQEVWISQEGKAILDSEVKIRWICERQKEFHLVK